MVIDKQVISNKIIVKTMSGKIHKDVDICVTCVCDKPPQLPLREELPSLGIEVIYNAKGVGAEATEKEFKRERQRIHQKRLEEKQKQSGKNLFSLKPRKSSVRKEDPPEDLAIPKALSYESYQRSFDKRADEDENSISSSIQTSESMDENLNRSRRKKKLTKRLRGLLQKKRNLNAPPDSVEFNNANTLEDAALQKAFNAFMDDSDHVKPNTLPKADVNNHFPDLLQGSKNNPEQLYEEVEPQPETEPEGDSSASSGLDQTTVSSLDNESAIYKSALLKDAEVFSKLAVERLNQLAVENGAEDTIAKEAIKGKGNIRVKLMSNGEDKHITEIYDLTEISESGYDEPGTHSLPRMLQDDYNDVVYHGSSRPTSPYEDHYNDHSSEESSVPVPTMCDQYGKQILDVSNVYEENGPGSPLVLSPVAERGVSSFALSPASFPIPDNGQGKKKRDPYAPSFLNNPMRLNELDSDGRDDVVVYRVDRIDDASESFRERNLSPMKLDVVSPYRSADKSRAESFHRAMEDFKSFPTKQTLRPIPSMPQNNSRDSNDALRAPKVSFSEDIEERQYFAGETNDNSKGSGTPVESLSDQLNMAKAPRTPKQILLEALSYGDPLPFDFEETIELYPTIASQKLPNSDTYALHAACMREFPKRFAKDQTCRVKDLVHDLNLYRKLIESLIQADPETCRRVDNNGDLPVHIMARKFMVWEGQWYQKVYDESKSHVQANDGGSGITSLYQSMSEGVNVLLQGLLRDGSLCLQPGSIGRILPLHIAAIFTVPYSTLKSLLEAFPNAASIKCDLSDIKTFVPNHSTALELHDRLSTDFPKWEIQSVNVNPNEEITQQMLDKIYGTMNGIRRSDLMFSRYPDQLPYRKEEQRIHRMEAMIEREMKQQEGSNNFVLTRTSEAFWVWLCEFEGEEGHSDNYAESVSRIISSLPFHSVRFLSSVLNEAGHPVVDRAAAECTDAILERLNVISVTQIPVRVQTLPKSSRSSLLNLFDEDISGRFRLQGQGFVGPLCRTIFNIFETNYPTSFVILPYKLVKDNEGRLGLESREAAQVAMKFAEFLSDLTTTNYIIDTLDHKICQTFGENLVHEMNRASRETRRKHFEAFLKLYEKNSSYFYFIDDCTGVPIVDESDNIYPLLISEAADTVEKVFPMMLSGMISMRGEKAVSILANVLLDANINLVLPNWIEAAKDLIGFIVAPRNDFAAARLQGLLPLQEDLIKFVEHGSTKKGVVEKFPGSGASDDWVVEISLIKMILEIRDPKHYFCGLSKQQATTQVLWTLESDIVDEIHHIDFESPKNLTVLLDKIPSPIALLDNETCSEYSSGVFTDEYSFNEMPRTITTKTAKVSEIEKSGLESVVDSASYSREESEQASSVDESFDIAGVEKLRVELDEQEAKLLDLRQKITSLDAEGAELTQREEKIGNMIDEISSQKEDLEKPSRDGLEKAKALLLRICELEDRVLCREVEVGQLKNDVTVFQLEASDRTDSRRLDENDSTSNHSDVAPNVDEQDVPKAPSSRDEDIVSVESGPQVNLNRVLGVGDEESSAGNSTMYDSSIDGYSEGYSTGMLRP